MIYADKPVCQTDEQQRPSVSKVSKSVSSLNTTLSLQSSLSLLSKYKNNKSPKQVDGTEADIATILALLRDRCPIPTQNNPANPHWKANLFYPPNTNAPTFRNPVENLNRSFADVSTWVHKYTAEAINQVHDAELDNADSDDKRED